MPTDPLLAWYPNLTAIMKATLPSCTDADIFQTTQINRLNWRQLINKAMLTPPFYVVDVMRPTIADGAMDAITYKYPVAIYGVYATNDPHARTHTSPDQFNIRDYAWAQSVALMEAIVQNTSGFYVVDDVPVPDVSHENPANAVYYKLNAALFAFQLTCQLQVGVTL